MGWFLVGGFYKGGRVAAGVDLSEDKGEGESTHHGVWPHLGRWVGGRSIRSIAGGGSYQDLKLSPTLSCLG